MGILRLIAVALLVSAACSLEASVPPLYTSGRTFAVSDHIVSTSVFHWFTANQGQQDGPWRPQDGRSNWTGEASWWQSQIKQMMSANIDALWVHLITSMEQQRINLFTALSQLRAQGYDVPKVAPFLDPMIIWDGVTIDVATTSGKDEFARHYIRWFDQYYSANTDAYADTYLEQIGSRVVLDTWHVKWNLTNLSSLTRSDVENRLVAAFAANHPVFWNGIRMVTTALNNPTLSFADEKVPQFEITQYSRSATFNSLTTVQLKGGYWDQNVRNPGSILVRGGGGSYRSAWNGVNRNTTKRAYIESWNEYDEGSGIYAADPGPPYIKPGSGNTNTDTWSSTNDPREYIHATASGAAVFNDTPDLASRILWYSVPQSIRPNGTLQAQAIVRNEGDLSWSNSAGVKFVEDPADPVKFTATDCLIDDSTNEIPTYGGIFRGRPITFNFTITAPPTAGDYTAHWSMSKNGTGKFGALLTLPITVSSQPVPTPAAPTDSGVFTRAFPFRFDWAAVTDPVCGIAGYNLRVGTTPGGSDVFSGYVGAYLYRVIYGENGKTYYCSVQAVDKGGVTSAWSASSDGITVDLAGPTAPGMPTDAGLYAQAASLAFNWTAATDSGSGVASYQVQVGASPGASDVYDADVGNVLQATVAVTPRRTYYCRVRAKDALGNLGAWSANSDGIGVVDSAAANIAAAKTSPDACWVGLSDRRVSAVYYDCYYVQDPDRAEGIRVLGAPLFVVGDAVDLYGALNTANGERVLTPSGAAKR